MRYRVPLLAAAIASVAAGPTSVPLRLADDYARLQGTWKLVSMENDGRKLEFSPAGWTIRGDTLFFDGTAKQVHFTLDTTKRPA